MTSHHDDPQTANEATTPLAITGVRLIDGTGADPIDRATVVVEGERVTAVGASDTVTIPRGAPAARRRAVRSP